MTATTRGADGSGAMFDRIAHRYDLLNRLISLGLDRRWRRKLVEALKLEPGDLVLDLATGTGDVAIAIAENRSVQVVGVDPSEGMLAMAGDKLRARGIDNVSLKIGSAEELPFEDASFASSCIAFGIRNVPDRRRGLAEMARVTRPGGRLVVLELGEPDRGPLAALARIHVHRIVPTLGGWLSGDREYRYLARSIAAFPAVEEFSGMLEVAGANLVRVERFAFGAANLFVADRR